MGGLSIITLLLFIFHGGAMGKGLSTVVARSYELDETVKLNANKLTSTKTLLPLDYYGTLPFCQPTGDSSVKMESQNLGQYLAGDRIRATPYSLEMKVDKFCERLCVSNLGRDEKHGAPPNSMVRAIRNGYHHNWIVDGIPAASRLEDETRITTKLWGGIPVGFVDPDSERAYVHNHVNIRIDYVNGDNGTASQIVGFSVQPFSINHDIEYAEDEESGSLNIRNPIESCRLKDKFGRSHTHFEAIRRGQPQPASGSVLFTYDVIWTQSDGTSYDSRWDTYLNMGSYGDATKKVRHFSVFNSLFLVMAMSMLVATILVRNLRDKHCKKYKDISSKDEDIEGVLEEFTWKLVHAHVFRPPTFAPQLLAACCGTGAQLSCTAFMTVGLAAFGILTSKTPGSLVMAPLCFFALSGGVGGYVSSRFCKIFRMRGDNNDVAKTIALTAFGFPGMVFAYFVAMNVVFSYMNSSSAVPFATIATLVVLWLGVSTPLVYCGARRGSGTLDEVVKFPVWTSGGAPRKIPTPNYSTILIPVPICGTLGSFTVLSGGILSFSIIFVELYFVLTSIWLEGYFNSFGCLLVVMALCVVVSGEFAIISCYMQLCVEDYHWWWHSFANAGSCGLYILFYSSYWFFFIQKSGGSSFATYLVYFGSMALASFGIFLVTGFTGLAACLYFNKTMYGSIKTRGGKIDV